MMERLLICMCCLLACYFHCSTATGGSQNIFRRPPPQYEDSGFYDYYISRGSSANLSLLETNGDCVPPRLPPGINATCQSLQNQNQTFALQDNPFLSSLLDSLDVSSFCQCDNVTAEPPMVCGSLCLGDNVLSEDRILDPQSGLTCGDVRIMAPHVDTVQFCPILSIVAPLCCIGNFSQQSLQEEDSCDLCNHNQSQRPFLLPLSPRHSQEWADNMLCPALKSFYAQQEQSNNNNTCSSYDIALREDWSLRYFSHSTSMWALPVNLSSLCCNSSTSALSRPPFCPSGTQLQPNSPVLADLTCGQLEQLLPHLAHEETYDSLSTYSSGCCQPPQPPQDDVTRPPGSTVRRVTTSLILASRTPGPTDADLDHLQEAFGSLVSEIVDEPGDPTTVTLRLRRGSSGNATIPKWDPASPRIDRFQTASCPSYWIEPASVCAQVEASYDLFVSITDQVASQDYPGRTENAINDGRLYRELRLAHPDTTLAVLGTADAAYQQRFNSSSGDMEDEDDKEERHMVFLLGVTVGIAVALIGWAIGRTMAAARRRQNTAVQPYPIDDAGHEKEPLNRSLEEDDAAAIHVDATNPETPRPMERRDGSTSRINSSTSRERLEPNLMKEECKTPIDPEPTPAASHKRSAGRGERREPRVGTEQNSIPQNPTPSEPPANLDSPRDIFFDPDQLVYDGSSPSLHRANVSKALFQADDDEVNERRSLAQTVLMERMVELELLERMKDCSSVVDSSSSSIAVSENEGSANHNEIDANYHHPRESERDREPAP